MRKSIFFLGVFGSLSIFIMAMIYQSRTLSLELSPYLFVVAMSGVLSLIWFLGKLPDVFDVNEQKVKSDC